MIFNFISLQIIFLGLYMLISILSGLENEKVNDAFKRELSD